MNKTNSMQSLRESSYMEGDNLGYLESLYETYLQDPQLLSQEWQDHFAQNQSGSDESLSAIRDYFKELARKPAVSMMAVPNETQSKELNVAELIMSYRVYGHHEAILDPLKLIERQKMKALTLEYHGLSEQDLSKKFNAGSLIGRANATLRELVDQLRQTYCSTIGVEYMHITDIEEVEWLQHKLEDLNHRNHLSKEEKIGILERLTEAEGLEKYLGTKYVGQKRFSLEGGDSLIPLMSSVIKQASKSGMDECVIGMAHRGRLNALVNLLGKSPNDLFAEFEGRLVEKQQGSGDVKYHKGFSSDVHINGGIVHLAMAFNPSHLEIVSPVVEGSVRARQRRRHDVNRTAVMPILIHGDAAMAGQGVVMETFNFSQVRGFCTGGSVHITINNQVGFTTSNPLDARSTLYCTDVAKMVQAPVFHVNGDDPEAVVFVAKLAADYRMKFHKDVVIDLVCYRRQGHNEADEPAVTQPMMYHVIRQLPTTRVLYANKLVAESLMTQQDVDRLMDNYVAKLDAGEPVVKVAQVGNGTHFAVNWQKHIGHELNEPAQTGVELKKLQKLAQKMEAVPESFNLHPQLVKLLAERQKMAEGELPINWGFAENLAYATLLDEGYPVRLCGQDSGRGTFAHRHAQLHDYKTGEVYVPLSHMEDKQAPFIVIDSILSEEAVLAFEYGYSSSAPDTLVLWEAQFGDFANGAQVVIDQFISSGEQKWGRLCGLVMLLPHGYEGMGPEHSSARLERYLQLCAQQNMQVCVPTTPAQVFHMLRRQMIRPARKPLIVMTPKSLLRHKLAVSSIEELTTGEFKLILPEIDTLKGSEVKRVVLCSGKVYYDLLQKRRDEKIKDVAIVRIEQQYPFPRQELMGELKKYAKATEVIWCQEEPKNQGAWYQINHHLSACLMSDQKLDYAGRGASASPAVGNAHKHAEEQALLVKEALGFQD